MGSGGVAALMGVLACTAHGQCGPQWADVLGLTGVPGGRVVIPFDPDGDGPAAPGFVVAGDFDRPLNLEARRAAFYDGVRWTGLGAGFDDGVVSGAVSWNGSLIVTGTFTRSGGQPIEQIARWTGSTWTPLARVLPANESISLTVYNGELVALGGFTSIGGVAAAGIARFDGAAWRPMATSMSGHLRIATVFQGDLVVGGIVSAIDGVPVNGTARWNGTSWAAVGNGPFFRPLALAVHNGELYAGGGFDNVGKNIVRWDGTRWVQVGPGGLGGSVSSVSALVSLPQGLVAGGSFTTGGAEALTNVAVWDGSAWRPFGGLSGASAIAATPVGLVVLGPIWSTAAGHLDGMAIYQQAGVSGPGWYPLGQGLSTGALSCTEYHGDLVVGGVFEYAGPLPVKGVGRWDGERWLGVGDYNSPLVRAPVWSVRVFNDDICIATTNVIARAVGNTWEKLSGDTPGFFRGLLVKDGSLFAYGDFSRIGGIQTENIARWDGARWSPLVGVLTGGDIYSACVYNGAIVVAGTMERASGRPVRGVAAWNGETWQPVGNGLTGVVGAVEAFDGGLYASGNFTIAGFAGHRHLARWNGIIWEPAIPGGSPNAPVDVIKVYRDALLVSGDFTTVGGRTVPGVCLWDGREVRPFADGSTFDVADWCEVNGKDWFVGGASELGGRTARHVASLRDTTPYIVEPEHLSVTCPGGDFDLHCVPADPGLTHSWSRDGHPVVDGPTPWGSVVSGSTTAVITVTGAGTGDAGQYVCEVTAPCGVAASLPARVRICKTDRNCDGMLDFFDFVFYTEEFEQGIGQADFNEDGFIDFLDFNSFMTAFDAGC